MGKKKKSAKESIDSNKPLSDIGDDEFEAALSSLKEANFQRKEKPLLDIQINENDPLCLNYEKFNYVSELKKLYGSVAISEFNSGPKSKRYIVQNIHSIVNHNPYWPPFQLSYFTIYKPESENESETKSCFIFQESSTYKNDQSTFKTLVEHSFTLEGVHQILSKSPYHLQSLYLLSEAARSSSIKTAADLIERALWAISASSKSFLNRTNTNDLFLPYNIESNRIVHLIIFRHIDFVSRKGAWRAALECCKLLIQLDKEDPLGVCYLVDLVAIQSKEYSWFTDKLCKSIPSHVNLLSWKYSTVLATFLRDGPTKDSFMLLKEAILKYPHVVGHLALKNSWSFTSLKSEDSDLNDFEMVSTKLYVERCAHLWRATDVLNWIKICWKDHISSEELSSAYKQREQSPDLLTVNLRRHVYLSDISGVSLAVPAGYTLRSYDPFPPAPTTNSAALPAIFSNMFNTILNWRQ